MDQRLSHLTNDFVSKLHVVIKRQFCAAANGIKSRV